MGKYFVDEQTHPSSLMIKDTLAKSKYQLEKLKTTARFTGLITIGSSKYFTATSIKLITNTYLIYFHEN